MSEITGERTHTMRTEPFARLFYYKKDEDFQAVLYLLVMLGLNAKQAAEVKWQNLDLKSGVLRLSDGTDVVLTPDILDFFRAFRAKKLAEFFEKGALDRFCYLYCDAQGNQIPASEISAAFHDYLAAFDCPDLEPEDVRATFPEYLYEHDMVTKVVRMYLENSKIKPQSAAI